MLTLFVLSIVDSEAGLPPLVFLANVDGSHFAVFDGAGFRDQSLLSFDCETRKDSIQICKQWL